MLTHHRPLPAKPSTPRRTAKAAALAQAMNNASNGGRLKRLTNTDSVFTVVKSADGSDKFRCKSCHRSFNLKCTLLRHVRHQHQGRFVPHPCPECGQVFKRTDHLKVHLRKIHGIVSASRKRGGGAGSSAAAAMGQRGTPPNTEELEEEMMEDEVDLDDEEVEEEDAELLEEGDESKEENEEEEKA